MPVRRLDEYGNYMTCGEACNVEEMSRGRYLPEGLVEGCRLMRPIAKDQVLTYDDVELPPGGSPTPSALSNTGTSATTVARGPSALQSRPVLA